MSKEVLEGQKFWNNSRFTRRLHERHTQENKVFSLSLLQIGSILAASGILGYYFGKSNIISKKWRQYMSNNPNDSNNLSSTYPGTITDNSTSFNSFRIVCFGDSTTWGFDPDTKDRLGADRWVNVLRNELNGVNISYNDSNIIEDDYKQSMMSNNNNNNNNNINDNNKYEVISEGLNGRTIDRHDRDSVKNIRRNLSMHGLEQVLPILYSHKPIDLVIVMLGINDCKAHFDPSVDHISEAMNTLLQRIKKAEIWNISNNDNNNGIRIPKVLLMPPIYIREITNEMIEWNFNKQSKEVSTKLPFAYYQLSTNLENSDFVTFADANQLIEPGIDGVHLNGDANIKLGKFLAPIVRKILNSHMETRGLASTSGSSISFGERTN